jgi:carboxylesterase type B
MNALIQNVIIKTRPGEVRGSTIDGVNSFKGIPYAAPPFGVNRLRPPQPVAAWSGVRDALNFGSTVPQPKEPSSLDELLPNPSIPGEDCLNLNITSDRSEWGSTSRDLGGDRAASRSAPCQEAWRCSH